MTKSLVDTALDALREGFAVFEGDDLTLTYANRRFYEILAIPDDMRVPGWPVERLFALRASRGDFGDGEPADHVKLWMERAHDPAAQEVRETRGMILERFVPIPGRGLAICVTDHTRIFEAEAQIARMAKFPDENPGPVLRFSADNRLLYANPSSRDLCQRAGCVGVGDPAPADWLPHFERARASGEPVEVEYENAGAVYNLLLAPVSDTAWINAYGLDITLRIQHAQALAEAKEAADRANLTKSQFLANMSHELRTPMNAILGFTKLVMRRSKSVLEEKQYNNLNKVLVSAQHLLALINNILDLSKIEAGRMEVNAAWFDLATLVELCIRTVEPLMKPGVELRHELPDDLPEIYGDEIKIKQVFINLLSNAAKFTSEGSVTLKVTVKGDHIWVDVTDTGIGIPSDKLGKVFEEFSQADGSTTREYGGTGLGLTICLRLAQLMDGDINVTSVVGEGSTFTVYFPIRHGNIAPRGEGPGTRAVSDDTEVKPRHSQRLVLSIDDDHNTVDLVRENLGESGFRVVGAHSGDEGLRMARLLKPAAILLDVVMGSSDGWQTLHKLKSDQETAHIPVIMLSIIEEQSLAFRLGAAEYLAKPISREELLRAVNKVISKQARILVVDDNQDVHDMLGQLLDEEGHTMVSAYNGEEALARIEDSKPDMVFLDLMMPVLDGFGVVARLRENTAHDDLPIVILTAKVLTTDEELDLRRRVHTIVTKGSVEKRTLVQEIEAVVGPSPSKAGTP